MLRRWRVRAMCRRPSCQGGGEGDEEDEDQVRRGGVEGGVRGGRIRAFPIDEAISGTSRSPPVGIGRRDRPGVRRARRPAPQPRADARRIRPRHGTARYHDEHAVRRSPPPRRGEVVHVPIALSDDDGGGGGAQFHLECRAAGEEVEERHALVQHGREFYISSARLPKFVVRLFFIFVCATKTMLGPFIISFVA